MCTWTALGTGRRSRMRHAPLARGARGSDQRAGRRGSAAGVVTLRRGPVIRLGGACLSVDLQQVGGDQLPVGRLSLVGEILPTGYRTTTCI